MATRQPTQTPRGTRSRAQPGPAGGTALRAHLVAAGTGEPGERTWPAHVGPVLDPAAHADEPVGARAPWSPYLVHGGPGTGKTSLIVDAAVARLCHPDVDPESVLVLAASRRSATALREEITRRVLAVDPADAQHNSGPSDVRDRVRARAQREPLVRTVHSYAFAVLRLQAAAAGNPPPRLITGSEQDVVLRELLAGDLADGAGYWPSSLRGALATDGFAQALRDLIMRAAERGVGPEELTELGQRHQRPEWVASGRAYAQYEHIMLLRGAVGLDAPTASAPAVDAAELIGSALSAFATDSELLAAQRKRIRHLLVDDAQHLDPQAAQLITLIGTGTSSTVIAADTDQSIYGFRGASPRFADSLAVAGSDRNILLDNNFRSTPEINAIGRMLVARLAGARPHPYPDADPDTSDPRSMDVRVLSSTAKEATAIADLLRRAHLFDGVPWSQMAVVVRSVSLALPAVRRAFRSAGVPLTTPTTDIPLHRQRAVIALMLVLRVVAARSGVASAALETDEVVTLLSGPIGAADPGALRRLRRGVRRIAEKQVRSDVDSLVSLRTAILEPAAAQRLLSDLTDTESAPLRRVLDAVEKAHATHEARRGVEETLWTAWQTTGLDRRWAAGALRGGPAGEQADRDLDAVIAMFEAAADFTDNLPASGPEAFVHYLTQLQIPRESRAAVSRSDSVTLLSAHAAAGREWDVVAVAGVLDGIWPSLRSRGSVLRTAELVDLLDGVDPDAADIVSRTAGLLAEERRLLLVACTRARRRLLVTAVEDGSGDASPSKFIAEIADARSGFDGATDVDTTARDESLPVYPGVDRLLSLPSLVATLRAAVVGSSEAGGLGAEPDARARAAAELLAQLADSDIPGAHPRDWYGLAGPSTDAALWSADRGPVVLSPSNVESLTRCPLRWMLEKHGGRDGDEAPAITGTLVHTLVQAVAGHTDPAEVTDALREIWDRVDTGAQWYSDRELERAEGMLTNFREWLRVSRDDLTVLGVEADITADVPAPDGSDDDLPVRLQGRIDRLERDSSGRPVVIDVKTGKTPVSKADTEEHAQLASYQLGITLGGVPGLDIPPGTEPGGGRLVYVSTANKSTGAAQRVQSPLTPELVDEWIGIVRGAARATVGPQFVATPNAGCQHCKLATSCPARLPGKAVTDD